MYTMMKIAGLILKQFGYLIADEFFWIILLFLIIIYKKSSGIEARMLGSSYPLFSKVSGSVLAGMAGGLLGSLLVMLVGISIEDYTSTGGGSLTEGITYIWIAALLLALINPRYLCFSYAGGLIALSNLIFGFPSVNVPGLLALVGVLHLVESFLIWLDGYTYSAPLFLRKKDGRTVGGYIMNRIWPIPLVAFAVVSGGDGGGISLAGIIDMPSWWPLLRHSAPDSIRELVYIPLMVPVVLGYGDMAVTKLPDKKCRSSALRLAGYSMVLIALSVIASELRALASVAAVFAPLAHEMLILHGIKEEEEDEPYFASSESGLKVLFVRKGSAADSMKLRPGDTILRLNGMTVYSESQLAEFLRSCPVYIWMDVKRAGGGIITTEYSNYRGGVGSLGVLIVPRYADFYYELSGGGSLLKKLLDRIKGKNGKYMDL